MINLNSLEHEFIVLKDEDVYVNRVTKDVLSITSLNYEEGKSETITLEY